MMWKTAMLSTRPLALGLLALLAVGCGEDTIQLPAGPSVRDPITPVSATVGQAMPGQLASPGPAPASVGRANPGPAARQLPSMAPAIGDQERAEIRANDERVEAQERGNTPTSTSLRKR